MKPMNQWGGTCYRLGRKESVGIGVRIKLPLLSQVGRAQEREGAKWKERKEGSTGKKDCQSQEKKRGKGKTTK